MVKLKESYYKKKRPLPSWSQDRKNRLIFENIMKKYRILPKKQPGEGYSHQWYILRKLSIPSSLIRKALSGTDNFLSYYEAFDYYSPGIAIEMVILTIFDNIIMKGYQRFSKLTPWISCTPDGFLRSNNQPVEIKTRNSGSLDELIRTHYHQLQFNIYCCNSEFITLIAYIFDMSFYVVDLKRDENFFNNCLPMLEFSFFKYLFKYDHILSEDVILKLPRSLRYSIL